jgi:polygalacturonase
VTIKSGSSDVVAERLDCTNSHGITIGSIWYDDVTNVTYRDCKLHSCHAGPRIKGREQGNATISDINFENIVLDNVGTGIQIDMTYQTPGSTYKNIGCTAKGVSFSNVTGTAINIGSLACLPTRPCEQFAMNGVDIVARSKHAGWKCKAVHVAATGAIKPSLPSGCT